jgi:acyl carrier protein
MSDTIEERLARVLKGVKASAAFAPQAHLRKDLELDSLDVMMLLFEVEKEFDLKIPEEDLDGQQLMVLGRLTEYLRDRSA